MQQRWRAWVAAGFAVVGVGVFPLMADRDSFPLSTFPMFAADIDRTQAIDTAVGVAGDGAVVRLTPMQIAGTSVVNQAAAVVSAAIVQGRTADLCRTIAARVDDSTEIEVVTERYDAPSWFDGQRDPVERVVHARCPVSP